jgi:tRNA dimethylallyltransferase
VRVIRALELVRAGSPAGQAQTRWRERVADWDVVYVGLTLDRARLDDRLRRRAKAMVDAGLEGEVRGLLGRGYAPTLAAMQGLGYREFVGVVQGRLDAEEALRLMRRDTLRYARRQWTWFAREPELAWMDVEAAEAAGGVAAAIEARLKQEGRIG